MAKKSSLSELQKGLLIGVVSGFSVGAFFLAGDGIAEIARQNWGWSFNCANRLRIGVPSVVVFLLIFRIMRWKNK